MCVCVCVCVLPAGGGGGVTVRSSKNETTHNCDTCEMQTRSGDSATKQNKEKHRRNVTDEVESGIST